MLAVHECPFRFRYRWFPPSSLHNFAVEVSHAQPNPPSGNAIPARFISGHMSAAIFQRCNLVDERETMQAGQTLNEKQKSNALLEVPFGQGWGMASAKTDRLFLRFSRDGLRRFLGRKFCRGVLANFRGMDSPAAGAPRRAKNLVLGKFWVAR